DGREHVLYGEDDLEALLTRYLTREEERAAVAAAGRGRALTYPFAALWEQALARCEGCWEGAIARAAQRRPPSPREQLLLRAAESLSGKHGARRPALLRELAAAGAAAGRDAELHYAQGLARPAAGDDDAAAAACFGRAAAASSEHQRLLPGLSLALALDALGHGEQAADAARRLLLLLEEGEQDEGPAPGWLGLGAFP